MNLPPGITLAETADGSPTLVFRRADGYAEKMHHSRGALSESRFIYGAALTLARTGGTPIRAMSIGLGLAYNELLTLHELTSDDVTIWSFESLPALREEFRAWAEGRDDGALAPTFARVGEVVGAEVRARAGRALARDHLRLLGPFPEAAAAVTDANLVYYDAYSSKMDPHLWDEDALVKAFGRSLAPKCVFASYAATGALNRVLERLGFTRLRRPGFFKKRQSTLATRGF